MTATLFPALRETPPANKFHAGSGTDGKHYWLTPPDLYARLDAEFHFDFDPCPYPLPEGFDGLTCEWGSSNYVNPPFGSIWHEGRKKGPTAWVRKAIAEHRKGKTVVLVYPIDKWVLMLLAELGADVRNLGDVRWVATEDGSVGPGTGRHIACFVLHRRGTMTESGTTPREAELETAVERIRDAARAALDEWDAATTDWLEWFAKGGKGFHRFPVSARNHLRAVVDSEVP